MPLKWKNVEVGLNLAFSILINNDIDFDEKYISFSPTIQYELPLKYKFISTSFFLSPNILQSISSDTATENQQLIYWNTGLRISIN